jgi:hypothetical protein
MTPIDPYNSQSVRETLRTLVDVFSILRVEYRFMGSIIPTALNGKLYRDIHDLDVIVVCDNFAGLLGGLRKIGYVRNLPNGLRFSEHMGIHSYQHPRLLEIGIVRLQKTNDHYRISGRMGTAIIPLENLDAQSYTFGGIRFDGIPASLGYTLSTLHTRNPKRVREFEIFRRHGVSRVPWPPYDFYMGNTKANWVIDSINGLMRVIGITRVALGKPYDLWR